MIRCPLLLPLAAILLLSWSCTGSKQQRVYDQKRREYQLPAETVETEEVATPGSLWRENRPVANLFTDARALRTNDLVVVKIEEVADARRRADTGVSRTSEAQASINSFLGLLEQLQQDTDLRASLGGQSSSSFRSEGATGRSERLTATVPAIVRKVLPNGNLFIEGHRVVLVNDEEQHFYISGVVRPIDIDQENSVKSTMVADAEIEFTGQGVLTDNQHQGWLSRNLGWIWPF